MRNPRAATLLTVLEVCKLIVSPDSNVSIFSKLILTEG